MIYEIEVRGAGREVYRIEADSKEDAERKLRNGLADKPIVSEIDFDEIIRIEVMRLDKW